MLVRVKYFISKCSTNLVSSLVSLITVTLGQPTVPVMKKVRVGVKVTQTRVAHVETRSVCSPLTWLYYI